jgi:hypothetical protein
MMTINYMKKYLLKFVLTFLFFNFIVLMFIQKAKDFTKSAT